MESRELDTIARQDPRTYAYDSGGPGAIRTLDTRLGERATDGENRCAAPMCATVRPTAVAYVSRLRLLATYRSFRNCRLTWTCTWVPGLPCALSWW
jgi:hypothetical protein